MTKNNLQQIKSIYLRKKQTE